MAIVATERASTHDASAPFESATLSGLTNGHLVIVDVCATTSGGTDVWETTFTLSGCGQTWTAIQSRNFTDSATYGARIKSFSAVLASFSSGVLTASGTGTAPTGVNFKVTSFSDVDGTGTIVQSAQNGGTGTAVSVVLSAFGDAANNACHLAVGYAHASAFQDVTYATLTKLGTDLDDGTQTFASLSHAWQVGQDTSPDGTIGASCDWAAIAVEIKAASAAAAGAGIDEGAPMIVQAQRPNVSVFARSMARAARKAIGDFRPRGGLWLPEAYAR